MKPNSLMTLDRYFRQCVGIDVSKDKFTACLFPHRFIIYLFLVQSYEKSQKLRRKEVENLLRKQKIRSVDFSCPMLLAH